MLATEKLVASANANALGETAAELMPSRRPPPKLAAMCVKGLA